MKMNKSVLQRGIIFVLCICLLFSVCPVYAFAAENQKEKVVRIGVPDDTYDKINENGKRSGYGYEYLQKIAGYTEWKYEYVDCTWENCFDKLKNDEMDIIEGISYTEERAEKMLFSGIPMGDERYCVYAKPDHTDILSSDTASFNGKKIGVLMDYLPEMDGLEATRQIRALNRKDTKEIPIIAMTANAFQDDIRDCIDAGMNAHIVKPINSKKIKDTLQLVLKQKLQ